MLFMRAGKLEIRWVKKGFWAIADQFTFSFSNFFINILLARWLLPIEYGAFAVAFSVFLYAAGFHNALVQEPMLTLGPANHSNELNSYLGKVFWMHIGCSAALAVLALIASSFVTDVMVQEALFGMALSMPFTLTAWVIRMMFYVKTFPIGAFATSTTYTLTVFGMMVGLQSLGHLSLTSVYFVLGTGSVVSALCLALIRPRLWTLQGFWVVGNEHLAYGKWLVLSAMLSLGIFQAPTFIVAGLLGLEAAGTLRAMLNLVFPMIQATTAIGLLAVPMLSRDYASGNLESLRHKAMVVTGVLVTVALFYELGLVMLASPVEQLLYGGKYHQEVWLIPALGVVPIFTALASGYSFTLRAIQRLQNYWVAVGVTAAVSLVSTASLTWWWGLSGAVVSYVGTHAVGAAISYILYRKWFVQPYLLHLGAGRKGDVCSEPPPPGSPRM